MNFILPDYRTFFSAVPARLSVFLQSLRTRRFFVPLVSLVSLVSLVGFVGFRVFQPKAVTVSPPPIFHPLPTPTPKSIPNGKQTFSVSSGKKTGPQYTNGMIDPYDPERGSPMIVSVQITSEKPVVKSTMNVRTDTAIQEVAMELKEGTATSGLWTGVWVANDTYLYTYNLSLKATDGEEENVVEITLR